MINMVGIMDMNDTLVFPVPKTITCPYCGKKANLGTLDKETGYAHYRCRTEEIIKVGKVLNVRLTTYHQFVAVWNNTQWLPVDVPFGSSRACEQISTLSNDWESYDNIAFNRGDSDEI